MKQKLYNVFLIIFSIIFITIFLGTIFDNKNVSIYTNPIILIICFIITALLLINIYKFLNKKIYSDISIKKEIIIFSVIFLVITIIQIIIAKELISYPSWDWNDVFAAARLYANGHGNEINFAYFQMFPNNYGILYFEIIIFKIINLIGIPSSNLIYAIITTEAVNIILIDIAIILVYFTVRNLLGKKNAIYSLILVTFSSAFFCYIPVLYTDTLTMLFPILMLFIYSVWYKYQNVFKKIDYIFLLLALVSVIGLKFKFTIIIMLIAIIIDMFLKFKIKRIFKSIILLFVSILLFQFIFGLIEQRFSIFPFDINNNDKQMPYTHWIMMGMTEVETEQEGKYRIGWYNQDSVDYTLSFDTKEERINANIKKINEQLSDYGIINYITFLYRKMLYTWSDGTYFAPNLSGNLINEKDSIIVSLYKGDYRDINFYRNTSFILFMYIFIILGAYYSIKSKNTPITSCYLCLFGVLLFFLIWESSSRYLINFAPIMIVLTTFGIDKFINRKNKVIVLESKALEVNEMKAEKVTKKMKNTPILYLVIPCYNEEPVLKETTKQLKFKMQELIANKEISSKSMVMYVNDGSKDNTWELIKEISKKEALFTGVSLSRNRGHQNALLGGLMTAKKYADIVISMDADLQDDINAIDDMVNKYKEGNDIVYGVRSARKKDTWFKRVTAEGFYKFMKILGVDVVYNHADYRLTSKRVLEEFSNFKEINLFLRGMFPLVGFKSDIVYYERNERFAGESKYPLKKMLNFAWDGITSFSVKPLRMICSIGFIILFISICIMLYSLIRKLTGNTVDGWTFLTISIWFIGGLQMICIGIIGEYIGKIYGETKHRPRYIISENLLEDTNNMR